MLMRARGNSSGISGSSRGRGARGTEYEGSLVSGFGRGSSSPTGLVSCKVPSGFDAGDADE